MTLQDAQRRQEIRDRLEQLSIELERAESAGEQELATQLSLESIALSLEMLNFFVKELRK